MAGPNEPTSTDPLRPLGAVTREVFDEGLLHAPVGVNVGGIHVGGEILVGGWGVVSTELFLCVRCGHVVTAEHGHLCQEIWVEGT